MIEIMNDARINRLNERFGVAGRLHFCQGRGDLIKAELTYQTALIELYLQGAHITRFNTKKIAQRVRTKICCG